MYHFNIYGHENILSTHKKTLEFTKDAELTKNGDCIVGVKADFELAELKKFIDVEKVVITITVDGISEAITAIPNKKFSSNHEMVIRLGYFDSERTFAVRADKASDSLSREIVGKLAEGRKGTVKITTKT